MRSEDRHTREGVGRMTPCKWATGVFLSCLALVMTGPLSQCNALDNEKTRESLRGLPGLFLMVEDVRVEIEEVGLTRNDIHGFAEKHLADAGIRLLSAAEWRETPGSPWLYLYAQVMRSGYGDERVYVFRISVEAKQRVILAGRPESEEIHATTWSRSILGKTRWIEEIKEGVEICLQYFVEAYRSVNDL